MREGDLLYRKATENQNRDLIDRDTSVLWLVTWFQNRQFYVSAHNSDEAKKKAANYIASEYKIPQELLDYVKRIVVVEASEIKWPN